jgi:hypothetical protein
MTFEGLRRDDCLSKIRAKDSTNGSYLLHNVGELAIVEIHLESSFSPTSRRSTQTQYYPNLNLLLHHGFGFLRNKFKLCFGLLRSKQQLRLISLSLWLQFEFKWMQILHSNRCTNQQQNVTYQQTNKQTNKPRKP